MTEAGIVSTCVSGGHGGTSGGRGGVGGKSPGRHSGSSGGSRSNICTDRDIRLLGLMRIDLLFIERELLWIGWNMERDMIDVVSFQVSLFE